MRLTDYTDYSLRALMYLGTHRDRLVTIQDIADAYGISKSHLMKVVHQLGLAGLIETIRGRSGGLRLGKEPEDINLGEVVKGTEPDFMMVECFSREHNECVLAPACELQAVLGRATKAYLNVLSEVTLADLIHRSPSLQKLAKVHIPSREKTKAA
ncbi:MAG TPA: Rrf2 family transcriptional regulator [Noviherbaspirillum sp.]|uniref:RrF2 family transcriptional regulator n=1 Tax=Noviherbaspirillum sp. TaxID=1926288 RepID=UPI002B4AA1FB|nr:Rrf2 family transcriptional regulator [Noviherbaspirillum sp.]HJV85382.1 Rrf2 family transcriptional regulator [Noviherbaspirillum sp.]